MTIFRYQDSVSYFVDEKLQYSLGHEVVYEIKRGSAEFIEKNITHQVEGEWRWVGIGVKDRIIQDDDGFESQISGQFGRGGDTQNVQRPHIDIQVFDDGSARTESKYSDPPNVIN